MNRDSQARFASTGAALLALLEALLGTDWSKTSPELGLPSPPEESAGLLVRQTGSSSNEHSIPVLTSPRSARTLTLSGRRFVVVVLVVAVGRRSRILVAVGSRTTARRRRPAVRSFGSSIETRRRVAPSRSRCVARRCRPRAAIRVRIRDLARRYGGPRSRSASSTRPIQARTTGATPGRDERRGEPGLALRGRSLSEAASQPRSSLRLRGRGRPNSPRRAVSVRREIPSSLAACV